MPISLRSHFKMLTFPKTRKPSPITGWTPEISTLINTKPPVNAHHSKRTWPHHRRLRILEPRFQQGSKIAHLLNVEPRQTETLQRLSGWPPKSEPRRCAVRGDWFFWSVVRGDSPKSDGRILNVGTRQNRGRIRIAIAAVRPRIEGYTNTTNQFA